MRQVGISNSCADEKGIRGEKRTTQTVEHVLNYANLIPEFRPPRSKCAFAVQYEVSATAV
jgi:hypothetical protein